MNQTLEEALARCFGKKRIVFWYDEGGKCRTEYEAIGIDGVEKLEIDGNEFGVKYRILTAGPAARFLVYSGAKRPDPADDWLYDVYLMGTSFSTDPVSMVMGEMGFPDAARDVVAGVPMAFFKSEDRKRDVKALLGSSGGRLSSEDLELVFISVLCRLRSDAKIEYVLRELLHEYAGGRGDLIDEVAKFGLEPALWRRLGVDYGYRNGTSPSVTDFVNQMFHDAFLPQVGSERYRLSHAALSFFNDWKNGTKTRKDFLKLSDAQEEKLGISDLVAGIEIADLGSLDVYRAIDTRIVGGLVAEVERGSARPEEVSRLVGMRKDGCRWDEFKWQYLAIEAASRFFQALSSADLSSSGVADAISKYSKSWYRIDQQYRLFVGYYDLARRASDAVVDLFAALKDKVDGFYVNNYLLKQSVEFQGHVNGLRSWKIDGVRMQSDFWDSVVAGAGASVCVIVSDALRYEIGAELAERIESTHRYSAKIEPMVAALPTYTQLGMAALLPHGELRFAECDGKPAESVLADGSATAGLEARKAILVTAEPRGNAATCKAVMDMTRDGRRAFQSSAPVLYVYHNVIDERGDRRGTEDETPLAAMEAVEDILKLISKIGGDYRIGKFIVTADHGFLYQDRELDASQYVADDECVRMATVCKNRFVVGSGLPESRMLANWTTERLGLGGCADVKVAKGVMRMRRQGSGVKFVHGGASLQEIVVPLVEIAHVRNGGEDVSLVDAEILVDGPGRITTNRFPVSVYQASPVGGEFAPCVVKLSLRSADGALLSDEVRLVLDSEAVNVPDRTKSAMLTLNHAANELANGDVELWMERGRRRGHGDRVDFDTYKVKPMTLRLSVQNFFD